MKEILEKCLKAEQGAIINWNKICQMTHGKDPMTYEIAADILAEEIEHESWFSRIARWKAIWTYEKKILW